jgi:hypothetical protein
MPVTGAAAVRKNMGRIFKDINEKKAPQFVNLVLSIGLLHSKELTPIAFGDLINSAFTDVDVNTFNGTIVGRLTYVASYAAALNGDETFSPLWKPRPLPKYEVKGGRKLKDGSTSVAAPGAPATNMNAKPKFLNRGFEDATSVTAIKRAEQIFKV